MTSIGNSAFTDCTSLEAVHITDIGKWAAIDFDYYHANPLYYAGNLYLNGELVTGELIIPDGVTSIGNYAFYGYDRLTSVTIPDSVMRIGRDAFGECTSLESVYITDIVKWVAIDFAEYDDNPLYYAGNLYLNGELVTDLVIPDGVMSIGSYAFRGCRSLTSITIPDSVMRIGNYAFAYCTSLSSVTIGSSVTSIGYATFMGCTSLTSVTIPNSVTSIGSSAFWDCYSLEAVRFEGTVEQWHEVVKGNSWNYDCPFTEVVCSDGVVEV